ncbi:type VI secretion system amidase immunity protein Tai4 [Cronobacter dublinensis]|nr:type VI secretion system amidase immunity protein Tai4 [Cronobacter dublinensis]EKF2294115.1 type VI secretion system amidase immunity protein Tai4 [Cronobacter dublinensis]EKF2298557.1 type VI secretion system amidase immunity protein Tai4 [Cronobacter dublinensis]EKK5269910.1 type VI secretion system amidase immunity protein Tai4 [Cronobacter dublinensis]EKM0139334.1 type VI secretion system amidase immunity protein Tai4 [Cronobacter dublinensis]
MALKIKLCLALTCIISSQAMARTTEYSPEDYLKNYALSTCIAQGYVSKEVKKDAAAAARGYLEFGDYSLEAHTVVEQLGKTFLEKTYGSQSGEPMTLAKCIDFYHSKELANVIKKYKGKADE